jgi:hypothetical protein
MVGTRFDTTTSDLGDKAINHAEREIDKHLSRRYDVAAWSNTTTSVVPPLVEKLCEELATGYMWIWNSRGGKQSIELGQSFIKSARENLMELKDYKADLLDITGAVIADKSKGKFRVLSNTDTYSNTFNEDDPLKWEVDSDKISDIDSERT